jgi:FlaA1/EpsC-like NDP-sugar epimerase
VTEKKPLRALAGNLLIHRYLPLAVCLFDCAAILIADLAGALLVNSRPFASGPASRAVPLFLMEGHGIYPPFLLMTAVLLYQRGRGYVVTEKGSLMAMMRRTAVPCLLAGMVFAVLAPVGGASSHDLLFLAVFLFLSWFTLVLRRILALLYVRREQKKGNLIIRLLLMGTGERVRRAARLCEENPGWGVRIVGFLSDTRDEVGSEILTSRVMGVTDDLPHILERNEVDALFFGGEQAGPARGRSGLLFVGGRSGYAAGWGLPGVETLSRALGADGAKRERRVPMRGESIQKP